MPTIGSIGVGLFILILVWILALIIFVVAVKYQSNFGWIALGSATLLTTIFAFIPVDPKDHPVGEFDSLEKDYTIIYKTTLLSFLILSALVGFLFFFLLHCIDPVRPQAIKDKI